MADAPMSFGFGLPFQEQIDFFRAKLNLPTDRWDDIWKAAHDRAFVVAGAAKADLLNDLRQALRPFTRLELLPNTLLADGLHDRQVLLLNALGKEVLQVLADVQGRGI